MIFDNDKINEITVLFRGGFKSIEDIAELFDKRGWDSKEVNEYYIKAKEFYRSNLTFSTTPAEMKEENLIMLQDILSEEGAANDFNLKLNVIKEINKMYDLYGKKKKVSKINDDFGYMGN